MFRNYSNLFIFYFLQTDIGILIKFICKNTPVNQVNTANDNSCYITKQTNIKQDTSG